MTCVMRNPWNDFYFSTLGSFDHFLIMPEMPFYEWSLSTILFGWKHGISYIKSWQKNVKFEKRQIFTKTQESRFDFYLNFILKTWCFSLGLY
jgi:hypothetical protein